MRIVIDLQGAQTESRFRGIGRYSLSLVQAMVRQARGHEIWLILNAAFPESIVELRQAFAEFVPPERIQVFDVPLPIVEDNPANVVRARAAEKIRDRHPVRQNRFFLILRVGVAREHLQRARRMSATAMRHGTKQCEFVRDLRMARQQFGDSHVYSSKA